MSGNVQERPRGVAVDIGGLPPFVKRLWPVALVWLVAVAVDVATGQRYSSVWGSVAIVATAVLVFPALRPTLVALGGYGAVWVAFNLVRAVAEDMPLALAGEGTVAGWERAMFGGVVPSAWAQQRWFDPDRVGLHDLMLSLVHGSFFFVPFAVAGLLWWRHRSLFWSYLIAAAATFALGTLGFLLLPTAPPWMSDPEEVTRIAHVVLAEMAGINHGESGSEAGYWFEPNDLAAMPSVHVAATVLVFLVARQVGRVAGLLGGIYALVMTAAVVYLGEHFVVDAVMGWVIALVGWHLGKNVRLSGLSPEHSRRTDKDDAAVSNPGTSRHRWRG